MAEFILRLTWEGRSQARDASLFPTSFFFYPFSSLLSTPPHPSLRGRYPTPSCPLPSFLTAASHRHLLFVCRGSTQWTILSVFPKISQWERDRRVSQGVWSSTAPGYKSWVWELSLLGPRAFRSIYTACLTAWLPDWLSLTPLLLIHTLSLSVLLPCSFPPTFHPGEQECIDWEGVPQTCVWTAWRQHRESFWLPSSLFLSPSLPEKLMDGLFFFLLEAEK